ncbi:MAG TPA: divergent polysaccharide deacetylase family protein, partial [Candidatus Dormibacteraeota bacterium]|nr:divergent polysaccharide deacetylase family protein [Candidatus Dormibacteraeota bacterium]
STVATSENASPQQDHGKLAIILDDLGSDRRAAEEIFDLPYPLTISVLPNHEHSFEIAEEAKQRGYEVMLHLPMQAVGNEKPEAQELRPGMPAAEVSKIADQFLQDVPGAVGVNNHQGSEATSDASLMRELMPVLREHHLFYIDSRTTVETVAYETAQSSHVPSAFRNVPFLDDVAEVGVVRKQLEAALRGAREKGEAVAIGHPHPATLQALREVLPKAQSEGVRLTFASELVH